MPVFSSSDRVQVAFKAEGIYPTNFGVLQGGNGSMVNVTGESLNFDIKTEQSKVLRSDRQVTDLVQVGAGAAGGLNLEAIFKDCDPLLEAMLWGAFAAYGTGGVSAAIPNLTLAAGAITAAAAPAGVDAFTAIGRGQWFSIVPAVGAPAAVVAYLTGRAFRAHLTTVSTATVITLDPSTPINIALAGAALTGARISSSTLTNGLTMRTFSLEVQHPEINTYRQYLGCSPSKFDLKFAAGALVTGSLDFIGKDMKIAAATGMGVPAAASSYPSANAVKGVFDVFEGGAVLSATSYIKSGEISLDNGLRAQEAVGVFGSAGIGAGKFNAKGKLEVYFADATMYNKFLNNTTSSFSVPVLDPLGNGYVYHFPKIKYSAAKVNAGGEGQDLMLSVEFQSLADQLAGSPTLGKSIVIYRVGV